MGPPWLDRFLTTFLIMYTSCLYVGRKGWYANNFRKKIYIGENLQVDGWGGVGGS